jgi:hypothetical protein
MSEWNCYIIYIVAGKSGKRNIFLYKIAKDMHTALEAAEAELKEFLRIGDNYSYGYRIMSIQHVGDASL